MGGTTSGFRGVLRSISPFSTGSPVGALFSVSGSGGKDLNPLGTFSAIPALAESSLCVVGKLAHWLLATAEIHKVWGLSVGPRALLAEAGLFSDLVAVL